MPPQPPTAGDRSRGRIQPRTFRIIAVTAAVLLGAIIVTGAGVRVTGSGLGCPEWPNCEAGSLAPRGAESSHAWVEFGNRLVTGVVMLIVIAAVLGALLRTPRRRDLTWLSVSLVAGVLAQGVVGGLVVIFELKPIAVIAHFLLSMVLLAAAIALVERAGRPDGATVLPATSRRVERLTWSLAGVVSVVLVLGTVVTATGPHGGDEIADRLDFSSLTAVRLHSVAAWVLAALAVLTAVFAFRDAAPARYRRRVELLVAAIVLQGALGYWQYATDLPALLVLFHVLGATLVWSAVCLLVGALRTEPAVEPAIAARPAAPEPAPVRA